MELAVLYKISEKYAMEDKPAKPKVVLERKGLSYTRSIRKQGDKRLQRSRSKSMPSINYVPPPKAFAPYTRDIPIKEENIENVEVDVDTDGDPDDLENVRVRQFSTTMKGLVNKGDLRKDGRRDSGYSTTSASNCRRSSSVSISSACGNNYGRRDSVLVENAMRRKHSLAYCTPVRRQSCVNETEFKKLGGIYGLQGFGFNEGSQESSLDECPSEYQVLVLGASGVGKSAITSQFTTSEFLGASDVHTDTTEQRTSVSVILNQEESMLDLIEENCTATLNESHEFDVDAYMLVYSCADRASFRSASMTLKRLKEETGGSKTVMIVANKVDLARKRQISSDEGRSLARSYNCKYIETSAALNHNVDELLAGILSQIRLKQYGQFIRDEAMRPKKQRQRQKSLTGALRTALRGVFGKKQKVKGCENLYEI